MVAQRLDAEVPAGDTGPKRPSRYGKLRKEPRRDGLSTIEAAGLLLAGLEKRPDIAETLNASFERMLARYREVQTKCPNSRRSRRSGTIAVASAADSGFQLQGASTRLACRVECQVLLCYPLIRRPQVGSNVGFKHSKLWTLVTSLLTVINSAPLRNNLELSP